LLDSVLLQLAVFAGAMDAPEIVCDQLIGYPVPEQESLDKRMAIVEAGIDSGAEHLIFESSCAAEAAYRLIQICDVAGGG
jgi:hypothetical protein